MIAKKKTKRKILNPWFFLLGAVIALFIVASWQLFRYNQRFEKKIYPNVYIDNQSFSGKTKGEIHSYFEKRSAPLKKISLTLFYEDSPVATFSGNQLALKSDSDAAAERAYLIGRSKFLLSRYYQKITSFLNLGRYDFRSNIDYDKSTVSERLQALKDQYDKPAKNALFKFENGRVQSFRKEENGREVMTDSVLADFDNAVQSIKNKPANVSIKIKPRIIEPEITLASINNYGVEELVAEGRSDFSHSIPERIHNIILASSKFNGVLIPPGKTLSFNATVGDISPLTGYKPAYIIKEGKTVLGDGGGVCQVSSTLFRAVLKAGLEILERHPHSYRVGYYEQNSPPGFDATVFAPSTDFKFKNDTTNYILIQAAADLTKSYLKFELYGTSDGRIATTGNVRLWGQVPPPAPLYQDDPTLPAGTVKQVDWSAWGSKAAFDWSVTRNGESLYQKTFYSAYQPWQSVYLRGTGGV